MTLRKFFAGVCLAAAAAAPAAPRVVRVEITTRTDLAGGKAFGLAGPYEKLAGTIFFAVSPEDPHNRGIV